VILFIHLLWALITVLRIAGVTIIFGGVGLFGVYFIGGNARAAQKRNRGIPRSSWRGRGPKKAIRIAAVGLAMLACAYVIRLFLPDGT
jgi:hypothetical protein